MRGEGEGGEGSGGLNESVECAAAVLACSGLAARVGGEREPVRPRLLLHATTTTPSRSRPAHSLIARRRACAAPRRSQGGLPGRLLPRLHQPMFSSWWAEPSPAATASRSLQLLEHCSRSSRATSARCWAHGIGEADRPERDESGRLGARRPPSSSSRTPAWGSRRSFRAPSERRGLPDGPGRGEGLALAQAPLPFV